MLKILRTRVRFSGPGPGLAGRSNSLCKRARKRHFSGSATPTPSGGPVRQGENQRKRQPSRAVGVRFAKCPKTPLFGLRYPNPSGDRRRTRRGADKCLFEGRRPPRALPTAAASLWAKVLGVVEVVVWRSVEGCCRGPRKER